MKRYSLWNTNMTLLSNWNTNMSQLSNLNSFLRQCRMNDLEIKHVYDIGACAGHWTHAMKNGPLFDSTFYMFEGNPIYKDVLSTYKEFSYIGVLSSPGVDEVEFYNGNDTGDSYYKETTTHYENKTSIKLPARTLQSVVNEFSLPQPDFIKIDTQGSELDIFAGAKDLLKHSKLVYMECPIIEYNKGAPKITQYLEFMKSCRFIPHDIFEVHRAEGVLLQIDIMFVQEKTHKDIFGDIPHIRPFA